MRHSAQQANGRRFPGQRAHPWGATRRGRGDARAQQRRGRPGRPRHAVQRPCASAAGRAPGGARRSWRQRQGQRSMRRPWRGLGCRKRAVGVCGGPQLRIGCRLRTAKVALASAPAWSIAARVLPTPGSVRELSRPAARPRTGKHEERRGACARPRGGRHGVQQRPGHRAPIGLELGEQPAAAQLQLATRIARPKRAPQGRSRPASGMAVPVAGPGRSRSGAGKDLAHTGPGVGARRRRTLVPRQPRLLAAATPSPAPPAQWCVQDVTCGLVDTCTESEIHSVVDAMVLQQMPGLGYKYVFLDDCESRRRRKLVAAGRAHERPCPRRAEFVPTRGSGRRGRKPDTGARQARRAPAERLLSARRVPARRLAITRAGRSLACPARAAPQAGRPPSGTPTETSSPTPPSSPRASPPSGSTLTRPRWSSASTPAPVSQPGPSRACPLQGPPSPSASL